MRKEKYHYFKMIKKKKEEWSINDRVALWEREWGEIVSDLVDNDNEEEDDDNDDDGHFINIYFMI